MKIIIIVDQLTRTDANTHLLDDMFFLRQQGIDVKIATLLPELPENTLYSEILFSKATFSYIPIGHLWDPREWKGIRSYLSQEAPDLVIISGRKAKMVGTIPSRLSHVPRIFVFAHDAENIRLSRSSFDDLFYRFSDIIIVASEPAKEELLSSGAPSEKIVIIPDGVSLDAYGKHSEHDIRKELGVSETEFIFIFTGDLFPERGADVLLRAFAKVPDGRLVIVGNGPEKKTLELLAENLGLQERVIFLSSYVDMPGLLAEAGAIIFPSKEKELDSAFVPGLLSGLPVITSDIPGVEEMIRNEENGLMVRKQDSDELAAAMKLIASDPELRASLQKNSRKGIERFSVSAHCAKILSLVQQPVKK